MGSLRADAIAALPRWTKRAGAAWEQDPNGGWVRYEDLAALAPADPTADAIAALRRQTTANQPIAWAAGWNAALDAVAALAPADRCAVVTVVGQPCGIRRDDHHGYDHEWSAAPADPTADLRTYVPSRDEAGYLDAKRLAPADPTADLRAALDVDLLYEAHFIVERGYINAPDRHGKAYWRKVAERYAALAASTTENEK